MYVKNKEGAASVLVVVMMLVLVVFGLAMLTTALAQSRLSQNHEKFIDAHYDLESKAQRQLSEIDSILYEAELETIEYIQGLELENDDYLGVVEHHDFYKTEYDLCATNSERTSYMVQTIPRIYQDIVLEKLNAYDAETENMAVTVTPKYSGIDEVEVRFTVSDEDDVYQKYLNVELVLISPVYTLSFDGQEVTGHKVIDKPGRFLLNTYQQEQISFEYDEGIKFENPFDKPE